MGASPRQIDLDVGEPRPPRGPLSAGSLVLPVQWLAGIVSTVVIVTLYLDHQLSPLQGVPEQIKELRTEIYHQQDAARDLALRDDRIAQLTRRIEIVECQQDRSRRCN